MAQVQGIEDEEIQKKRILVQHAKLKAMATAFAKFAKDIEKGSVEQCEKSFYDIAKDVRMLEYWNLKMEAVKAASLADAEAFKAKKVDQEQQVEQAQLDIERAKKELEEARTVRQHNEEYEKLREEIMEHPSRQATLAECHQLEADTKALEAESVKLNLQADKKRKQFALLMHYMDEFLASAEDEQDPDLEGGTSQQLNENEEADLQREDSDRMELDD